MGLEKVKQDYGGGVLGQKLCHLLYEFEKILLNNVTVIGKIGLIISNSMDTREI